MTHAPTQSTTRPVTRAIPSAHPLARAAGALAVAALFVPATFLAPASAQPADGTVGEAAAAPDAVSMGFSPALSGPWEGRGAVFENMEQERPYIVKCDFSVDATETTFALGGECGALFVKRPISVMLERDGEAISGTYDANLRTGTATLTGADVDGAIVMDVEWGGEVNGDTSAGMRIVREDDALRIVFTDTDPVTNEERTTSDLVLRKV